MDRLPRLSSRGYPRFPDFPSCRAYLKRRARRSRPRRLDICTTGLTNNNSPQPVLLFGWT